MAGEEGTRRAGFGAAAVLALGTFAPGPAAALVRGAIPRAHETAIQRCFPGWARRDLRLAASVRHPVTSYGVQENEGNFAARLTSRNMAAWFGEPVGTRATVASLLKPFQVHGLTARSSWATLTYLPSRYNSSVILLGERSPSRYQARHLSGVLALHGPAAVTLTFFPGASRDSLRGAVRTLLTEAGKPGGQPFTVATATNPSVGPAHYMSYAGPLHPATWLTPPRPPGQFACTAGPTAQMGLSGGQIRPLPVWAAFDANGITFALTPGYVVVDNEHAGFNTDVWFRERAIRVPTSALHAGTSS